MEKCLHKKKKVRLDTSSQLMHAMFPTFLRYWLELEFSLF